MRKFGSTMLILGVGSFILPMIGLQFKILNLFGDKVPFISIGLIIFGLILILIGKDEETQY